MITPLAKKCSISLGRSEFFIFQHGRFNELHEGVAEKIGVGDIHTNTIEGFWSLVKRGIDRRRRSNADTGREVEAVPVLRNC